MADSAPIVDEEPYWWAGEFSPEFLAALRAGLRKWRAANPGAPRRLAGSRADDYRAAVEAAHRG
jgi:hypothetical protein